MTVYESDNQHFREVIANSMLHRELECNGWITAMVKSNIAYLIRPSEYVPSMDDLRRAGF